MRGENQLRPLLRKLSWWTWNVSPGPSQQAVSASSASVNDGRNTSTCSNVQPGRPEDITHGANEPRIRAALLPRPNISLKCPREGAAHISTSVDVTTANAPETEGTLVGVFLCCPIIIIRFLEDEGFWDKDDYLGSVTFSVCLFVS